MKKRILFYLLIILSSGNVFSQNVVNALGAIPNWRMGGNLNATTTASTVFGTMFAQPIYMYTAGTWRATLFNNTGGFAINRTGLGTNTPGALLHIGDAFGPPGSAGHRTWMNVGTFCWQTTDNMYVGLKDETALFGTDSYDAIIDWGDNFTAANPNPNGSTDNLRFVFTEPTGAGGPGSGQAGLEVMRMLGNGNVGIGNWYVGPPNYIPPQRRLHVYQTTNAPQFRISYALDANVALGKYCDFQTTPNGDLGIFAFDGTQALAADRPRFVGIQTGAPGNTLEINSQAASPTSPSINGSSGLRFADLKYNQSVPAAPLNGQGVLSVDANGDVVYITAPTSFGTCSNPSALSTDAKLDLNSNTLLFYGTNVASRVGIGFVACPAALAAKLIVNQSSGTDGTYGIHVTNTDQSINRTVYGIFSQVLPSTLSPSDFAYTAGFFHTKAAKTCTAVDALADGTVSNGVGNTAGRFVAMNGGNNYGIFASVPTTQPGFAGYFDGNVWINGTGFGSTSGIFATSDAMFKTNIDTISNATALIRHLRPKQFYFDTTNGYNMHFPSRKQYGFVAQDVESILPELVIMQTKPAEYDTLGNMLFPAVTFRTLNENAFFGIIVKGFQEQQNKIDSMVTVITAMQSQMNSCCTSNSRTQNQNSNSNQTDVTLSNIPGVVLDQNVPNPFAEQTTIAYSLPDNFKKAQMLFYDAQGKLIRTVELTGTGKGQLNVIANDLSTGIYTYALIVDGQVMDTKKMVKAN